LNLDKRGRTALAWSRAVLASDVHISSLAGDASFRRYFRVLGDNQSWVLMDAPPGKEDVAPFLNVRCWLEGSGMRVPHLLAQDSAAGFLLLEDFGDITWAAHVQAGHAPDALIADALRQLHGMQANVPPFALPAFDLARMRMECDLYLDWYLPLVAGHRPGQAQRQAFYDGLMPVLEALLILPRVPVHLDYHSRNLMLPDGSLPLGVIDFQDAVMGPLTYDLASLLYDCYQDYPEDVRRQWSRDFSNSLPADLQASFADFEDWHRTVRLTALQRHIKAIGIFARLAHRDGKRQFLCEIPLARKHLREEMEALDISGSASALLLMEPA